ncbi:MAG: ABC transporter permease [Anaerolineae bacterium]
MDWLDPRWRKVLRDIWNNKARTVLVVLAIAVGVFAFGGMFITQQVLLENMNEGFLATNPATITVDMAPFEESVVRTAQRFPYVAQIGARATTGVEVWDGDSWTQLTLVTAPDVAAMDINRIELEAGTLDLRRREILLERQSLAQIEGAQVGSRIAVELPDGRVEELTVAGVVHDFNTVPASRIPVLTGYVSRDTLRLLGLPDQYNELQIVTVPQVQTTAELDLAAGEITELLERYGQTVRGSTISEPGEHWGADFIEAIVLVLQIMGL